MNAKKAVTRVIEGGASAGSEPVRQCVEAVEAQYYDGEKLLPEYRGRPLITALGPIWDPKSIFKALGVPIAFSESERAESEEYRMHATGRLSRLVVAVPAYLDIVSTVQIIIRQHYVGQEICSDYADGIRDRYRLSQDGELVAIYPHQRSHAHCSGIFGLSGGGKSTALEAALRLLPKVIWHRQYGLNQVVWIKIDCPKSASLKDTLKLLILTFDDLLGTDYTRELGQRATLADYANKIHRICRRHHTGLIVIDEIQNALQAVAKNDPLFDFFVNLTNVVGIPVIVSGTPKAADLFRKTLRSARRLSSQGVTTWTGMRDPDDWNLFCDQLQKYQWIHDPVDLSGRLRAYLYSLTQGLPGVAIPLFQLTQMSAIASGAESLSRKIFSDVFNEKMASLKPMMDAIRSSDKKRMLGYDDLLGDTLDDIVESAEAEAKRHSFYVAAAEHDRNESAISAVSRLMLLGIPQEQALSLVSRVQEECPAASSQELSNEAARRFYQTTPPLRPVKTTEKRSASNAG